MKMKKFVALLLATLMVFSLFAVNTAVFAEEPVYDAEVLGADGEKVACPPRALISPRIDLISVDFPTPLKPLINNFSPAVNEKVTGESKGRW